MERLFYMGIGKIGLILVERVGKYVKATGKRCVLETTGQPKLASLKEVKYISQNSKTPKILNKKTGAYSSIDLEEIASFPSIPKDGSHYDLAAYDTLGNEIGLVRLKDDPHNGVYRMLGENNRCSLYIDFWATHPEYKGIGKAMLKEIVKLSKRSGYGGRVSLSACTGSIPRKFMAICRGQKIQDVSCAIKYKKMGFKSTNPEIDTKIEQAIANGESGIRRVTSGLGTGFQDELSCSMELSPNAIKKYLENSVWLV